MNKLKSYLVRGVVAASVMAPVLARAEGEPLDLTSAGSTLAGYIGGAATAGVAVFTAIYGIRVIVKAFRGVAK